MNRDMEMQREGNKERNNEGYKQNKQRARAGSSHSVGGREVKDCEEALL